jgi:hypothetical protein
LAAWKGIAVENGSELHFEFSSFPAGGLGLLAVLGVLAALLLVLFVYRRDGKHLSVGQRVTLGVLRGLAVLAAAVLLLEPNLVAIKRETRPGHTILLLDKSQSMSHLDAFRREESQPLAQGWREVGVANPAGATRMELVKALLSHKDGELVKKLAAKNQLLLYGFDRNLDTLPLLPAPAVKPGEEPVGPPPAPRLDLAKLEADGPESILGGAVRTALEKSRSAEIAALVILSDGRISSGPRGAEIVRLLNQRKVPHTFVLGIGDPAETQLVGISRVEAPEKVFQKDPFQLKANVVAQGYDTATLNVRLLRIDDKGAQQVVRTQQITAGGDKPEVLVEFKDVASEESGRFTYRVEVQPPDGEAPSPERHQKNTAIEVLGERVRVLLLAGSASHEFQILRNLLIRDKTIDVSCWLQSADSSFPQDGDTDVRIDKLPEERAQFDPYDVAILIDPNQALLSPTFCDNLRRHVLENGCGLWWVCGDKYTLEAMRQPPTKQLADLLPVVPDFQKAERRYIGFGIAFPRQWPYLLTPEGDDGIASKVTRLVDGKDETRLLWGRLPGHHFAFPVLRPKPAASVLAETTNPELKTGEHNMPMVVSQFVGSGRVLFAASDESYRWRSIYEDAYNKFWVNGVRFLHEGRLNAGNARLRLLASDEKIELSQTIKITAEAKNEVFQPLVVEAVDLQLEKDGHALETIKLGPVEDAPGNYEYQFRPTATGFYRVRAVQKEGREVEIGFQVVPSRVEREGPMDRAELAAIAAATGGELCNTPAELLAAVDKVQSRSATDTFRTPHAVWDSWGTVAFMLTALALEWWLRKRFNLL